MAKNLFCGFKQFVENYTQVVKHQLGTDMSALMSQPVVIGAGQKLGSFKFRQPTMMWVVASDENTVTLANVPQQGTKPSDSYDRDGEYEVNPGTPRGEQKFVIPIEQFKKLITPDETGGEQSGGGLGGGLGGGF